jgi:GT2 family glycosyltransferase
MATPDISVVIASHRRETRLAFALDALHAQTLDRNRFEVLVVRPVGHDGKARSGPDGLDVRFLESARVSAALQRDEGWRAARAPLIAFTDDDCRPTPEWLEALLAASAAPDIIVQGRTEPDPDESHLLFTTTLSQRIVGPSGWYETCNIAYPRELLERIGGFDAEFTVGGEDTDLGIRATDVGASLVFAENALVLHAVHARPLYRALTRPPHLDMALVLARHPRQRDALYMRTFWSRGHALLLLGLIGAAAARGRRTAILGFAPYFASELRHALHQPPSTVLGSARLVVELAERFAIDLAELVANGRRSLRHRTLLL